MFTEERYSVILDLLSQKGSVTVTEIKDALHISESTVRRDLNALDQAGRLCKVFGGAVAAASVTSFVNEEPTVEQKQDLNVDEKKRIAAYAASFIGPEDFVYLDAGTTTAYIIDFITEKSATFVTNAVSHAQKLSEAGFQVMIVGGLLRNETQAVVGAQAVETIRSMHFTKGFFGTNGISRKAGFTTPDNAESLVKKAAFEQSNEPFILADHEKFGKMSRMTFADFDRARIITDEKPGMEFDSASNIEIAP